MQHEVPLCLIGGCGSLHLAD